MFEAKWDLRRRRLPGKSSQITETIRNLEETENFFQSKAKREGINSFNRKVELKDLFPCPKFKGISKEYHLYEWKLNFDRWCEHGHYVKNLFD